MHFFGTMIDQLPYEIQRKIITSLSPISLLNASNVCSSIRKLNLSHLLIPNALESMFTLEDYNYLDNKEIQLERTTMYNSCNNCYQRWADRFNVPLWRILLQDLIYTIDTMLNHKDISNSVVKYYNNMPNVLFSPIFYTSRFVAPNESNKRLFTHAFYDARKLGNNDDHFYNSKDKQHQLSFYALVY